MQSAIPSTQTVATNIVTVTTESGSGLDRHIGVGTTATTVNLTLPSTIGIVTGAGAGRSAETSVSARQPAESHRLRAQTGSNATTGNDTVPTTTAATTRTTTTTTVSGPANTTSGTDNVQDDIQDDIQDSNDVLSGIFSDNIQMEERGRRWRATLPRETNTSDVSRSSTPNTVTSNHTMTRPTGIV